MQSIETFDLIMRNNYSFQFCLLDVCGQSIIRGSEKLFIELLSNGRGSFDYTRNVAKNFADPEPNDPSSNSKHISSRHAGLNFHHADSKRSSTMKKKLGKLTVCVLAASCKVLPAFPNTVESRNQTLQFFFSFWPRHYSINNIQTKSQLILRKYFKK